MFFYFFPPFLVKVWYQSQRRTLVGSEQLLTWNGCFIFSMDGGLTGGSSGSSDSHQINLITASLPKDSNNGHFIFFVLSVSHTLCALLLPYCAHAHTHTVLWSVSEAAEGTRWLHPSHTLIADLLMEICPWKTRTVPLLPRNLNKLSVNLRILIQCWGVDGWMHACMASAFLVLFSF